VGGGTLAGLSSLTTGVHQYALIRKLCQDGDLSHIDLTMADLSREQVGDLPPEATAANFAKVADDATPSDKMLGIVNLVLQSIGTMSVLACKCCGTDTVVLTGALTMLPPARETFELFKQLYHVNFIIPENATFATAIGAALYSVREN
jgi:pantothenate kinase